MFVLRMASFLLFTCADMKIAIPLFGSRISPRFDFSPELWMITVENGDLIHQEKLPMTNLSLSQRLDQLTSLGIDQVICGGIDGFCVNQLGRKGIGVLHNVVGEAEVAFNLFLKGRLRPGLCCEKRRGRRVCGWKKVPPWRA
jgi:predicted Fe-Mo cluster-binding NifX family protein